jgi:hypothetical protein
MVLWLYYGCGARKYLLLNKYEDRELDQAWALHPMAILLLYFVASFGLMLLAAMFRDKAGPFAQ